MRSLGMAAAVALLLAASAPPASAAPVAGVIVSIEGKPKVKAKGKDLFRRVKLNQFVYEGDMLQTGKGERLAVAFIGGAEFRMNEGSEFEVQSGGGSGRAASLKTSIGQAWTRMLHGLSGVKVKTPMAVAAVRGTEADIDLENPNRLAVKVYEGHVDLLNAQETKTLVTLQANQMSTVGDGGAASAPRTMSAGDQGTWQNGLQADKEQLNEQIERLRKEGERTKVLQLQTPDGVIELPAKK